MIDFFKKLMEQALDLELTVRFTKRDGEWFAALGDELGSLSLEELEKDALILDVLGQHVAEHYIKGKMREWDEYQTRVSSWELEKYLVIY